MVLAGAPLTADEAVANGFAFAKSQPGQVLEHTMGVARQLAAQKTAALVANKRLLRDGWADHIDEVWQREKAEMVAIAAELGSIGWSR
jgi:enoyl-CoA hydratase/carnithine racemase